MYKKSEEHKAKIAESMKGNQNARKNLITDMLRRKLIQEPHRIETALDKQFAKAEEGDLSALNFITDRLQGKPMQATEISGPDGEALINAVTWNVVKPDAK